ncbi:hypothetical protein ACFW7K_23325 [Streptomyces sp. NPDC058735]
MPEAGPAEHLVLEHLDPVAAGIDRDAVLAGLTPPWSSGVVEGHVK